MTKLSRTLSPLILLLIPLAVSASYSPGELIVRLRTAPSRTLDGAITTTGSPTIDAMVLSRTAAVASTLGEFSSVFQSITPIVTLTFSDEANLDSLENALSADPSVDWVTRNYLYQPNAEADGGFTPNDSLFSQEWWLQRIQAPLAWEITQGDSSIVIGIIDTGVDYHHPDLASNLWRNWADSDSDGVDDDNNGFIDDVIGWDFTDAPSLPAPGDYLSRDNDPMDELGHGTYVAGIAAAVTDNQECVASVGYNCRIMCLRAGNSQGFLEEDDIAAALLYGAANGAAIINMSFGDNVASPLLRETVLLAYEAGVVLVGSAGNGSSDRIHYPSGYSEVIGVGATDELDRRASDFSNYGPSVDVMAPGRMIQSTILGGDCGEWIYPSGTSYASPLVCGVAGLVLSAARAVNAQLSPADVAQIIVSTADDIGPGGWDPQTVHGRVNARRAVEQAAYGSDVVARISSPRVDQGMTTDFPVYGEAWGAAFDHYELSVGLGEDPDEWDVLSTSHERIYGDSLGWIELPPRDTVMIVRLQTWGAAGTFSVATAHVFVQREAPVFTDSVNRMRMLDGGTYGDLVQVQTNQVSTASFILTNTAGDSIREDFGYVANEHAGLLSQENHPGEWDVRVRLENQAGLASLSDSFRFAVNEPSFVTNLWERTTTNLANGFLGPFTTDYDCDGLREVWLQPSDGEYLVGALEPHEWNGTDFVATGNTYGLHIPQAFGDADGDGLMEMMARISRVTRIWEQSVPCGIPDHVVFEDTSSFFGEGYIVLDSSSATQAILASVKTDNSVTGHPRYILFTVDSDYELTPLDTLPNLTEGENVLGPPYVLVGDLDQDGLLDFVYGDYDGDLIFCERDVGGIAQVWSTRLPINDATAWCGEGDLDGDGHPELVAGCRSNVTGGSESDRRSLHWEYFFFERTADNEFTCVDSVFVYGNERVNAHHASVTVADVDADGRDDVLISAFPDFYIVSHDSDSGRYRPRWYYTPSEANTSVVADWNGNGIREFFMADGQSVVRVEAVSASGQRPPPPLNLRGEPNDAHSITLAWHAEASADSYRVYQASTLPDFTPIAAAVDTSIVINGLEEDTLYSYAVTAMNSGFPNPESVYSNYATLAANDPPTVADTGDFIEPHFVQIRFSEAMGESAALQWSYRLDGIHMPTAISPSEGGRLIHLAFSSGLTEGWHTISLLNLRDAQGTRLPSTEDSVMCFVSHQIPVGPRVVAHHVLGGVSASLVEIEYSDPMSVTVVDPQHYHLDAPRRVTEVTGLVPDYRRVQVHLDPRYPVGALDLPARLQLRGLTNATGQPMDTTAGRADLILGGAATNIAEVFVYPNPYRGSGPNGESVIMFAGLPDHATVRVFTIQGTLVRKIEHRNATGAARWDLRNEDGDDVASGVYFFTAESDGETVKGKLAILR